MIMRITSENSDETTAKYAPVIQQITRPFESLQFDANVDTLSLVGQRLTAVQLYSILVESVCRSLRLIEKCVVQQLNNKILKIPETLHFKPRTLVHLITITYPAENSPDDTSKYFKLSY